MKKIIQLILLSILFLSPPKSEAKQVTNKTDNTQIESEHKAEESLLKSSQLLNYAQNLLEQSHQSYNNGDFQKSENLLKQILEVFGESNGRQPNFLLPDPGGRVRRTGFNLGIIRYESTNTTSPEVAVFDTTAELPLGQLFNYAVSRISSNPLGFQLADFQSQIFNRFGGCLRYGASGGYACKTFSSRTQELSPDEQKLFQNFFPSEATQEALDFASVSNTNRNIYSVLKDALNLIQLGLIAQGGQEKYEEALLFSEMSRSSEFIRIAPVVLYGLLNYETLSNNSSYSRRFGAAPSYDLDMKTVKGTARRQNATIVYYSTVASDSKNTLFVWVIQPSGDISFKSVDISNLGQPLKKLVQETLIASASFIDRGQQGRSLIHAVRSLRSDSPKQETDLTDYLVKESVQIAKLRLLYDVLVEPISDLLPTDPNSHIIFVPHRELTLVPFAALQDSKGRYLVEKHTISISNSLSSLRKRVDPIKKMPTGSEFVAVGNSDIPDIRYTADNSRVNLPSLPAADSEIVDISPNDGYWFRRNSAAQSTINKYLKDAKIIHFATHGLLNFVNRREFMLIQLLEDDKNQSFYLPQNPKNIQWNSDSDFTYKLWYDRSRESRNWQVVYAKLDLPGAIVLADSPLTTENILSLNLKADLVVLSACNTGRGVPTESAILGLPLAFGLAGVPRTVVSQWAVPDQSTRLLMIEFYKAMERNIKENGQANPAGALREAMLKTKNIEGYRDPIFWAGFTMMNTSY